MYTNVRHPSNRDVKLDFQSLTDQGKDLSKFPSHETVAYRMGQDIPRQKERFIGIPQGPKSANEV